MLKILPIIPSQNFDPLFLYFIPTSSPIRAIATYSCNIYFIGDNNVHNTHSDYIYTGEQDIVSADFSSEST